MTTWNRRSQQDRLAHLDPQSRLARQKAMVEASRETGIEIPEVQAITPCNVLDYIFAGKSIFTLKSLKSGKHITYLVKQKIVKELDVGSKKVSERREDTFFISVMTSSDNNSYTYLGVVARARGKVSTRGKSSFNDDDPAVIAIQYAIDKPMNKNLRVYHDNSCGRCRRRLTVPTSIKSGIGPICEGKIRDEKRAKLKNGS